jgi:ribonuclease HI
MARLYKARYFPNCSLFESKIGHNPSYAWRGIWKAREILMNGCRWKVGNGTKIKVMSEPWLRGHEEAWVSSPQTQGAYNITVNDLMVPNMKLWDKEKIESLFSADVAKNILEIPLFDMVEEDKLLWVDNLYGHYSVKSGYKLMLDISGRMENLAQQEDWNCLWKIHAPPKAKHLLWRICRGCLPTRCRLQERHVNCPLSCPTCEQHEEDEWHLLFCCNNSVLASQASGIHHHIAAHIQQHGTAKEVIKAICKQEDSSVAGRFAMLVWIIWNNRNNIVWNEASESGRNLGIKSWHLWEEWNSVNQQQHSRRVMDQQQHSLSWHKPPMGWQKCNVDAGFHQSLNKTSVGWCLRDHLGNFMVAGTAWNEGNCSIVEGEAHALLEALSRVEERGITHVIFETDSKNVVDAIHKLSSGFSEFSAIICNIQNVLSRNPNFVVKFIKRQANMVAHTLARVASSWASRCICEILPLCISSLLNNEMI